MTVYYENGAKKTYGLAKSTAYVFGYRNGEVQKCYQIRIFHCDYERGMTKVADARIRMETEQRLDTEVRLPAYCTLSGDADRITPAEAEFLKATNINNLWTHDAYTPEGNRRFVGDNGIRHDAPVAVAEPVKVETRDYIEVPSKSKPGETHRVKIDGGEPVSCDCEGFHWRRRCTHMKDARELLGAQVAVPVPQMTHEEVEKLINELWA